jgi:hypothetical protein
MFLLSIRRWIPAILTISTLAASAQPTTKALADSINTLALPAKGHVGTWLLDPESGDSCMTNGT